MRVRALCTPIPRCQVRPGSIRAGELDRAPANAHRGPNALELADPARPDLHTTRRQRFSSVRRAHGVAAAILEGRPDRGRHKG
jgi:hypothetical protein